MLGKKPVKCVIILILVFYIPLFIISCRPNGEHPDISASTLTINAKRFEKDLFEIDSKQIREGLGFLRKKYGNFFNLYAYQITSLGSNDSSVLEEHIKNFIADSNFRAIYYDCKNQFGDLENENEGLTKAFRYYNYYFPQKSIPSVVTMISGFSYPVVCDSTTLGISLDMFLGPDYHFYSTLEPPIPNYLRNRMRKEYLVRDAMKGWAQSDYGIDEASSRMIEQMISQGRLLVFLDKILPDVHDTVKSGYTKAQLDWCRDNEKSIWSFFVDNKLLFSIDPNLMNKYVQEGPTTNGFPKESPGNIGQYIGWNIVRSYMKNHPQISLQQLMEEKDLVKIFSESKYSEMKLEWPNFVRPKSESLLCALL